jgi:hypothetical protein
VFDTITRFKLRKVFAVSTRQAQAAHDVRAYILSLIIKSCTGYLVFPHAVTLGDRNHPSMIGLRTAYLCRRWLLVRRSLPLPCCGPCDSLLYAIDIGSTGSESRGLRSGPSRSSSVRVHHPTNERTVRIVSVLPVARVVSALLQRCCNRCAYPAGSADEPNI